MKSEHVKLPPHAPGISTSVVFPADFRPAEHVPIIAQAGFKCIEANCAFGAPKFEWESAATWREMASVCADNGISLYSIHTPTKLCPESEIGQAAIDKTLDILKRSTEFACNLGAAVTVIHARVQGTFGAAVEEAHLRRILDGIADYVTGLPCRVGWENDRRSFPPVRHMAWMEDYDPATMGFVWDTGHSNLTGNSMEYPEACGSRLCSLHINDNDGVSDLHLLPGQGTIEWPPLMKAMMAKGYSGPLMLEITGHEPPGELARLLDDCMASLRWITEFYDNHSAS